MSGRDFGLRLKWGVAGQIEIVMSVEDGWKFECRETPYTLLCPGSEKGFPDCASATRAAQGHKRRHLMRLVA